MIEDYEEDYPIDDMHTSTDAESSCVDYEALEDAFYRALVKYHSNDSEVTNFENVSSDIVDFNTSTDSSYMTCDPIVAPSSTAQQSTIYLLDIRNILFLFLIIYFVFTSYSKIKTSIIHLYKAR